MPEENEEKSRIERMKKRLYSRSRSNMGPRKRRRLRGYAYEVKEGWAGASPKKEIEFVPEKKHSILGVLLIASGIFFLVSLGASIFFFFGNSELSPDNVDIIVQGPATIGGGETMSLQITVFNRNSVPIEFADLIIEFPSGTRSASDLGVELPRIRESLGTIPAGGRVQKTVRSVLFGAEHTKKAIAITVEYRVQESNAIFFSDQIYELTLSSSPITLRIDALKEITSGQEIEFTVVVTSNSSNIIEDVLLAVEYPFGFEFKSATPISSFTDSVWALGDIEPEGERTVVIRGTVLGEDNEERVFRFSSGIQDSLDEKQLNTTFITSLESVIIKKPFITVELALDGNTSPEHVVASGKKVRADIVWVNNLPVKITNAELRVKLTGDSLDKLSVSAESGFYRSIDNTIIWSKETYADLASISPGDSGRASFTFASFGLSSGVSLRNPMITLEIDIKGKRISARNVPEEIQSSLTRIVKITSDMIFTPRAVYFAGPFLNNGPLPPEAEKETTYTVLWTVTNSSNAVSDARIMATLPSYVRWMNTAIPVSEDITFNPIGGQIVWNIGDINSGGGIGSSRREIAFQIALLPSISQIGDTLILVNEQTVSAFDQFTQTEITNIKPPLTTRLSTDPGFRSGSERVAP